MSTPTQAATPPAKRKPKRRTARGKRVPGDAPIQGLNEGTRRVSRPPARSASKSQPRATPEDALAAATRKWLRGERLEAGRLAEEIGVGRATLFRWVGTREQLYGAVIQRVYADHRAEVHAAARGQGLDRLEDVTRRSLEGLSSAPALRAFIAHDPEFAIRVLTSPAGAVQRQTVALEAAFLGEVVEQAGVTPELDLDTLAYIVVRIGEAFIYADTITGSKPEIDKAVAAIRILVSAERRPTARGGRRRKRSKGG